MSASDKITDFAISKLNAVFDAVQHVLPTMTRYVLEMTQLGCLLNLLPLVVFIPGSIVSFFVMRSRWRLGVTNTWYNEWHQFSFGLAFVLFAGLALAIILILVDGWNLVCIFRPDLYLIHLAVQKVLGG